MTPNTSTTSFFILFVVFFDKFIHDLIAVLHFWNALAHLVSAGLFHSIYSIQGFQGFSLLLENQPTIKEMIGTKAEHLCWIFCMVDLAIVNEIVVAWNLPSSKNESNEELKSMFTFLSQPELGHFEIKVDKEEWLDFIELCLTDWLKQVEGAVLKSWSLFLWNEGEVYAY